MSVTTTWATYTSTVRGLMSFKFISENQQRGLTGSYPGTNCLIYGFLIQMLKCAQDTWVIACRKNSIHWGKERKALFAFRKITVIIFTLGKKIESPDQVIPFGKQGKTEVLNGSPMSGGRRAVLIPPPHLLVTRPPTPGIWAPYSYADKPWPGAHPLGLVPGRGRGHPCYSHAAR